MAFFVRMHSLSDQIQTFEPKSKIQEKTKALFLQFISENPDCLFRSNLKGHITASAIILDKAKNKVLLIHHKKLDRWLQPGGHCDGVSNTLEVAIKEVWEETGIKIKPQNQRIQDLDIHEIPERKGVPTHLHYDVRYIFEADSGQDLIQNEETNALKWMDIEEIGAYGLEENLISLITEGFK